MKKITTRVHDRRLVDFKLLDEEMLQIIGRLMSDYYIDRHTRCGRMPWLG